MTAAEGRPHWAYVLRDAGSLPWLCPAPQAGSLLLRPGAEPAASQPPFPSSHVSRLRGSSSRCVSCLLCAEATRELPALSPDAPFPNETQGLSQDHRNLAEASVTAGPAPSPARRRARLAPVRLRPPCGQAASSAILMALPAPPQAPLCLPSLTRRQEPSRHLRLHFQNGFPPGKRH